MSSNLRSERKTRAPVKSLESRDYLQKGLSDLFSKLSTREEKKKALQKERFEKALAALRKELLALHTDVELVKVSDEGKTSIIMPEPNTGELMSRVTNPFHDR